MTVVVEALTFGALGYLLGWVSCALLARSAAPDGSDSEAFARGVARGREMAQRHQIEPTPERDEARVKIAEHYIPALDKALSQISKLEMLVKMDALVKARDEIERLKTLVGTLGETIVTQQADMVHRSVLRDFAAALLDVLDEFSNSASLVTSPACQRHDAVIEHARRIQTPPGRICPTCESPSPHLHPAVQHEGEVQPCGDPWHT